MVNNKNDIDHNEQMLDDELVLTNEIEEQTADDNANINGGDAESPQTEQTFRQALHEQIHEEDTAPRGQKISLIKILGGDFFTAQILRRNIPLMVLIVILLVAYISSRYQCEKSMLEIDRLKMELQDAKYKALSTSSRLTEQSRQSNVLDMLKNNHDSVLHIADRPPFIVYVEE